MVCSGGVFQNRRLLELAAAHESARPGVAARAGDVRRLRERGAQPLPLGGERFLASALREGLGCLERGVGLARAGGADDGDGLA